MKKHSLINDWSIWFSYLSEEEEKENKYADHLDKVHHIKSVEDLVYIWQESHVSRLDNFFTFNTEQGLKCYRYEIQGKTQIINSINFFKRDIQPSWEDKENAKGGRLIFQVERSQQNFQQIYEALVFHFLGEDFENSDRINGIRFISAKNNQRLKFYFRVEIWVNYNETETQKISEFRNDFHSFLEQYHINNLKPSFKSNTENIK